MSCILLPLFYHSCCMTAADLRCHTASKRDKRSVRTIHPGDDLLLGNPEAVACDIIKQYLQHLATIHAPLSRSCWQSQLLHVLASYSTPITKGPMLHPKHRLICCLLASCCWWWCCCCCCFERRRGIALADSGLLSVGARWRGSSFFACD